MRAHVAISAAALLLLGTAAAEAQDIGSRVRATRTGTVRLTFAAKPGVCGDGETYIATSGVRLEGESRSVFRSGKDGYNITINSSDNPYFLNCEEGPLRVAMQIDNGQVIDVSSYVGKAWGANEPAMHVSSKDAVAYLLRVVEHADPRVAGRALTPIILADSVEPWRDLLRIARNEQVHRDTRKKAIFWIGQEAAEEATRNLQNIIRDSDDLAVRKSAIFALSQQRTPAAMDALMDIARTAKDRELRKSAIFWLGQSDDPRVLAMFEEILLK